VNASPIRVFIVDDHPLVRDWLRSLLQMEPDFEVVGEADEPAAALAALSSRPADVAVVDLSLRRGSGLDLIKSLRSKLPQTRVLVLSMHEEISDVERALRAGAHGYVMKAEASSQIVAAIRWVHAGKVFATPETFSKLAARASGLVSGNTDSPEEVLSDRELHVFRRIGEGLTTRRIADELGVSQKTIQTYCARIKEKIGLEDGAELNLTAIRWRQSSQL